MLRMPVVAAIAVAVFSAPAFGETPSEPVDLAVAAIPASVDEAAGAAADPFGIDLDPGTLVLLLPAEEIDHTTDIRPYLGAEVQKDLRNAALRKAWLVNEAIHNHRGLESD
jgi:hypothetical protein